MEGISAKEIQRKRGELTISIGLYKVQGHNSLANDTSMVSAGDKFLANVASFFEVDCIQSHQIVLQWYSLPYLQITSLGQSSIILNRLKSCTPITVNYL